MPAVPIRRSVQQDHVVCLECGYRARVLRRHLRATNAASSFRSRRAAPDQAHVRLVRTRKAWRRRHD
jgi:predicted transcriptional regulator